MRKWDYAEMTKEAKKHGGPEQYLSDFGDEKYKEGELSGEKKGELKGVVEGSFMTISVAGIIWGITKIRERRKKRKAEKLAECREKANIAAQKYVDEINKYDSEYHNSDKNEIES